MPTSLETFLEEAEKEKDEPKPKEKRQINHTMASFFSAKPLVAGDAQCAVPRYGRIYKRKPPDMMAKRDRGQLSCPPGFRFCRMCAKPQPLDCFYTNVKRFVCKKHHYQMIFKRSKQRFKQSPYESLALQSWTDLHWFCPMMGYAHVAYDRHDIKDLFINCKIPADCEPRVVPIDPRVPMRPRNVAVISRKNMALLSKLFPQSHGVAQYILFVQNCNLVPAKADVGTPKAPFQNPDYVRQDLDVTPILSNEKTLPIERPYVDAVYSHAREAVAAETTPEHKAQLKKLQERLRQLQKQLQEQPQKRKKKKKKKSRAALEEEEEVEERQVEERQPVALGEGMTRSGVKWQPVEGQVAPPKVRREKGKVGRPRTRPIPVEGAPKRKRGRPRTRPEGEEKIRRPRVKAVPVEGEEPKKKRGRPRTKPIPGPKRSKRGRPSKDPEAPSEAIPLAEAAPTYTKLLLEDYKTYAQIIQMCEGAALLPNVVGGNDKPEDLTDQLANLPLNTR
jgi:hypothetical protein